MNILFIIYDLLIKINHILLRLRCRWLNLTGNFQFYRCIFFRDDLNNFSHFYFIFIIKIIILIKIFNFFVCYLHFLVTIIAYMIIFV